MGQRTDKTLFGGSVFSSFVSLVLPKFGQHDFKWVDAMATIGKKYGHYAFRHHPMASPVNVHVYGDQKVIEHLAKTGRLGVYELEIVEKTIASGKKYVFVNLRLMHPATVPTHSFQILPRSKSNHKFFFGTDDMHGMGIGVDRY